MSLDQIVSSPFYCGLEVGVLSSCFVSIFIGDSSIGQYCHGRGHWQSKLDIITSIMVASTEVLSIISLVISTGISSPWHSVVIRKVTRSLSLIEQVGQPQYFPIVISFSRAVPCHQYWNL